MSIARRSDRLRVTLERELARFERLLSASEDRQQHLIGESCSSKREQAVCFVWLDRVVYVYCLVEGLVKDPHDRCVAWNLNTVTTSCRIE
jgi:hypothetical protein